MNFFSALLKNLSLQCPILGFIIEKIITVRHCNLPVFELGHDLQNFYFFTFIISWYHTLMWVYKLFFVVVFWQYQVHVLATIILLWNSKERIYRLIAPLSAFWMVNSKQYVFIYISSLWNVYRVNFVTQITYVFEYNKTTLKPLPVADPY